MREAAPSLLPYSTGVALLSGNTCGIQIGLDDEQWPLAIYNFESNTILRQWDEEKSWWVRYRGASSNGTYLAIVAEERIGSPGWQSGRERARVGFVDVLRAELRWSAQLTGRGSNTVGRIVVSDDGRYVVVAGWNNGTAVVDTKDAKILWASRPESEVSTVDAVFARDGNAIFTGGTEGCVYGQVVRDGNVTSRRWATASGGPEYGHRISCLAISPDGNWLAAGTGPEGDVYLWNLKGSGKARILAHGKGTVLVVAFSPESDFLASAGGGLLRTWQIGNVK